MNDPQVTITPMTIDDYDEAGALWRRTEGVGMDEDSDGRGHIQAYLKRNPGMSFAARAGGELVGAVLCGHDGRRGYLHHLAVAAERRGRGIGQALVERCLAALAQCGIPKCNLFVFRTNDPAGAFWKALGWNPRDDLGVLQKKTR